MGQGERFVHQHNYCYYEILKDHILTWFGCPLTIVTNQGTYLINDIN